MPTYQYACTACGQELEAVQSFSDPALTECPQCQGALRKVFSAVGVVFKGSGFYKTDSRAAAKTASAPSEAGSTTSKDGAASSAAPAASSSTPSSTPSTTGSTSSGGTTSSS